MITFTRKLFNTPPHYHTLFYRFNNLIPTYSSSKSRFLLKTFTTSCMPHININFTYFFLLLPHQKYTSRMSHSFERISLSFFTASTRELTFPFLPLFLQRDPLYIQSRFILHHISAKHIEIKVYSLHNRSMHNSVKIKLLLSLPIMLPCFSHFSRIPTKLNNKQVYYICLEHHTMTLNTQNPLHITHNTRIS